MYQAMYVDMQGAFRWGFLLGSILPAAILTVLLQPAKVLHELAELLVLACAGVTLLLVFGVLPVCTCVRYRW